jgi:hypothetical protein
MRTDLATPVLAAFAFIAGCSHAVGIAADPGQPIHVRELASGASCTVQPASDLHARIAAWISQNRSGWSQFYATPANLGVLVDVGSTKLQFMDTMALAYTPSGIYEKHVAMEDYAFIKCNDRT